MCFMFSCSFGLRAKRVWHGACCLCSGMCSAGPSLSRFDMKQFFQPCLRIGDALAAAPEQTWLKWRPKSFLLIFVSKNVQLQVSAETLSSRPRRISQSEAWGKWDDLVSACLFPLFFARFAPRTCHFQGSYLESWHGTTSSTQVRFTEAAAKIKQPFRYFINSEFQNHLLSISFQLLEKSSRVPLFRTLHGLNPRRLPISWGLGQVPLEVRPVKKPEASKATRRSWPKMFGTALDFISPEVKSSHLAPLPTLHLDMAPAAVATAFLESTRAEADAKYRRKLACRAARAEAAGQAMEVPERPESPVAWCWPNLWFILILALVRQPWLVLVFGRLSVSKTAPLRLATDLQNGESSVLMASSWGASVSKWLVSDAPSFWHMAVASC